jgi:hypothetical protein
VDGAKYNECKRRAEIELLHGPISGSVGSGLPMDCIVRDLDAAAVAALAYKDVWTSYCDTHKLLRCWIASGVYKDGRLDILWLIPDEDEDDCRADGKGECDDFELCCPVIVKSLNELDDEPYDLAKS